MNVGAVYTRDMITAESTDTLGEAAQKMSRSHIGVLAVVDNGELVTAIAEEASTWSTAVEDYMTEDPVCVDPEDDVATAARRMVENGIGYLFVMQRGLPVGVVSRGDLLAAGAAAVT